MESEKIFDRLKQLRIAKGLSQTALAKQLGITPSYVSAMERGEKNITRQVIEKLIELFEVSADWFISGLDTNGIGQNLHLIPTKSYTQSVKNGDLGAEKGQNKTFKIRGKQDDTFRSWAAELKNDPEVQAYRKRAEQWTEKQAEFKELFKSDLRHNNPAALQLITESDHLLWLAGNVSSFHMRYFKAFTASRFGFDALTNPDLNPETITYNDYREELMRGVAQMEKYRAAVTTANAKMREALRELLPFDEDGVIQRFLVDEPSK